MTNTEVLVIGAGPAGIAAAAAAAEHGRKVIVLDDNGTPGGQIWRGSITGSADTPEERPRQRALERLRRSGARVLHAHRVFAAPAPGLLQALHEDGTRSITVTFQYDKLILATGARERFLPFPGWTLPGVFGAGGLQALVKSGLPVKGKRVVVAGTGPLLLAVAAHLQSYGAHVVAVAEQASLSQLAPFAAALCLQPRKLLQGLRYRASLQRAPYKTGCWPVSAIADASSHALRAVRLTDGNRTWDLECDLLACGFHLTPNTELAVLLGAALHNGFVQVDSNQQTSIPNIFCAGEPTGIAGLGAALLQGKIAGLVCAGADTRSLTRRAAAERAFGARLNKAFALRAELKSLAADETIVCRCEDIAFGTLKHRTGWTDAKLHTRCGMGPCQGRVCGPALDFLLGWTPVSIRPPIFPVPLQALFATTQSSPEENR